MYISNLKIIKNIEEKDELVAMESCIFMKTKNPFQIQIKIYFISFIALMKETLCFSFNFQTL